VATNYISFIKALSIFISLFIRALFSCAQTHFATLEIKGEIKRLAKLKATLTGKNTSQTKALIGL
jgi:hypothetical protein